MGCYYVYILRSDKLNKYYIGATDDVPKRFDRHNSAHYKGSFTEKGIPWKLMQSISCSSSKQAYQIEKYIKSRKSVKFIEELCENMDAVNRLTRQFT